MEPYDLKNHLETTKDKFDVTAIFDRTGYSPLHFAAYKNSDKLCEILCEFVLRRGLSDKEENSPEEIHNREEQLKFWIN